MAPNVTYGTYAHLSIEMTSKDYNDPIKATRHLSEAARELPLGREDENKGDNDDGTDRPLDVSQRLLRASER